MTRPYQLLMMAMSNLWYRGRSLYSNGQYKTMIKVATLHSDEIELVVSYGLETLGADFMIKLAEILIERGSVASEELQDNNALTRAVAFGEAVEALAREQPMVRLP